jgi:hypothetical protein
MWVRRVRDEARTASRTLNLCRGDTLVGVQVVTAPPRSLSNDVVVQQVSGEVIPMGIAVPDISSIRARLRRERL